MTRFKCIIWLRVKCLMYLYWQFSHARQSKNSWHIWHSELGPAQPQLVFNIDIVSVLLHKLIVVKCHKICCCFVQLLHILWQWVLNNLEHSWTELSVLKPSIVSTQTRVITTKVMTVIRWFSYAWYWIGNFEGGIWAVEREGQFDERWL